jgi:hypothetical protein
MCDAGVDAFIEVSPGRSLWGLLGQLARPSGFSRRYLECPRGPARHRLAIAAFSAYAVSAQESA